MMCRWNVALSDELDRELRALPLAVQDELLAQAFALSSLGPGAGRPRVDSLKGSRFANMKELRFEVAGGVWRVAFAFDPQRTAVLLVAGNKAGGSQTRFYRRLIRLADQRYTRHLDTLENK